MISVNMFQQKLTACCASCLTDIRYIYIWNFSGYEQERSFLTVEICLKMPPCDIFSFKGCAVALPQQQTIFSEIVP